MPRIGIAQLVGLASIVFCSAWIRAEPAMKVEVAGLEIMHGTEGELFDPIRTTIDLWIRTSDAQLIGLSERSLIESITDSTGSILYPPNAAERKAEADIFDEIESAFEDVSEEASAAGWTVTKNERPSTLYGIDLQSVAVDADGRRLKLTVEAPGVPQPGSLSLTLRGTLALEIADGGTRVVHLKGVDLSASFGSRFDVEGHMLECSMRSRRGHPGQSDTRTEFGCSAVGPLPIQLVARGSESQAPASATENPNLVVLGDVSSVDLDVVLSTSRTLELPLDTTFGLGMSPQ